MGTLQLDESLTPGSYLGGEKTSKALHRRIICTEKQNNIEEKQ